MEIIKLIFLTALYSYCERRAISSAIVHYRNLKKKELHSYFTRLENDEITFRREKCIMKVTKTVKLHWRGRDRVIYR